MKIAYLSTLYPFRGGIAQFNASLYEALQENHEVQAYTFKRQYPDFLFPGKTQYVTEDDNSLEIPSQELLDTINPLTYYKTAKIINDFEPDILLMKYWMSFFGPSLGTVAKKMGKKTKVITILDNVIPHEKRFFDTAFTNYFLKQNDGFIAMSNSVKNDLLSLSPKNPNVLLTPHPFYDHFGAKIDREKAQAELKLDPTKKTILFFGFIRDYKGLDLLIDAFCLLDDSHQLVIAGETYGSFDKYQEQIDQKMQKDRIHVHNDYISDHEVPYYFSASDVCVLPYKSATQSGITSIAHHFELPMIATDVGGLKETIIHEKNGLIVNEVSTKAIANSMDDYFKRDLKPAFVEDLRSLKAENSWSNFGKKLVTFAEGL